MRIVEWTLQALVFALTTVVRNRQVSPLKELMNDALATPPVNSEPGTNWWLLANRCWPSLNRGCYQLFDKQQANMLIVTICQWGYSACLHSGYSKTLDFTCVRPPPPPLGLTVPHHPLTTRQTYTPPPLSREVTCSAQRTSLPRSVSIT